MKVEKVEIIPTPQKCEIKNTVLAIECDGAPSVVVVLPEAASSKEKLAAGYIVDHVAKLTRHRIEIESSGNVSADDDLTLFTL